MSSGTDSATPRSEKGAASWWDVIQFVLTVVLSPLACWGTTVLLAHEKNVADENARQAADRTRSTSLERERATVGMLTRHVDEVEGLNEELRLVWALSNLMSEQSPPGPAYGTGVIDLTRPAESVKTTYPNGKRTLTLRQLVSIDPYRVSVGIRQTIEGRRDPLAERSKAKEAEMSDTVPVGRFGVKMAPAGPIPFTPPPKQPSPRHPSEPPVFEDYPNDPERFTALRGMLDEQARRIDVALAVAGPINSEKAVTNGEYAKEAVGYFTASATLRKDIGKLVKGEADTPLEDLVASIHQVNEQCAQLATAPPPGRYDRDTGSVAWRSQPGQPGVLLLRCRQAERECGQRLQDQQSEIDAVAGSHTAALNSLDLQHTLAAWVGPAAALLLLILLAVLVVPKLRRSQPTSPVPPSAPR